VAEDEHVHVALQVIRPPTVEFTIHVVYAPDGEIWKKVPGTSVFLPRQRVEHALRRAYRKISPKRALAPEETFLLPHQLKPVNFDDCRTAPLKRCSTPTTQEKLIQEQ
jgi:hypothetical protein